MEKDKLLESKTTLVGVIENFNKTGRMTDNSDDLQKKKCYEASLVLTFLKKQGYMNENRVMIKPYPNPSNVHNDLYVWAKKRRNRYRVKKTYIKNTDTPSEKLIKVLDIINQNKRFSFTAKQLKDIKPAYYTSLRTFLIDKGYINNKNILLSHIENTENKLNEITNWYAARYVNELQKLTEKKKEGEFVNIKKMDLQNEGKEPEVYYTNKKNDNGANKDFSKFTNQELVDELRRRGIVVLAEQPKIIY